MIFKNLSIFSRSRESIVNIHLVDILSRLIDRSIQDLSGKYLDCDMSVLTAPQRVFRLDRDPDMRRERKQEQG